MPLLARRMTLAAGGIVRGVGTLYGWNTTGAAAGAALATYGLLPAAGLLAATRLAAAVNLLIAAGALLLDARRRVRATGAVPSASFPEREPARPAADPVALFLALQGFGLSGLAAITFEVAWARLLAMVMGSSVYAFGTLVVVVLAGLGIGSAAYGRLRLGSHGHLIAFGIIELLIGLAASFSLLSTPRLPFLFMRFFPIFKDAFEWQIIVYVFLAAIVALVPALLFGATFPAVVGGLGGGLAQVGRTVGTVYAANTAGTVLGAFLAGFLFIPTIGLRATIVIGVLATLTAGVSVLLRAALSWRRRLPALLPAVAALFVLVTLPPWPREVLAAGVGYFAPRYGSVEGMLKVIAGFHLLYYRDGVNTTISVDQNGDALVYRSNGKTDASTYPTDIANQLLLGHLPMLRHPAPQDVFVLGLGTGVTAAAVARYPVRRLDIIELEPATVDAARFFDHQNHGVLNDPRVRLLLADGRNRLRAARDRYDVVISDPSDIWVAGIASLFTREFYAIVRARLRPGGLMVQWIHTHSFAPRDLALLAATFRSVFPHLEIWSSGVGDLILLGGVEPAGWDYERLAERIEKVPGVADDLRSIGIWHPAALFGGYVLGDAQVVALAGTTRRVHTDDLPTMEFETPRWLYVDTVAQIGETLARLRGPAFPAVTGFDPSRDLDADATYLLGFAYASLGQSKLGIPYMERSTTMAPERPAFFVGLANQYREVGRPRDAEESYIRALALEPDNVEALTALGEVLLEAGQAARAASFADRALRLAPSDARAQALAAKVKEHRSP